MRIYIVTSGEYSDYHIDAVFIDKTLAEEYINGNEEMRIEEWAPKTSDSLVEIYRPYYTYALYLNNGETMRENSVPNSWDWSLTKKDVDLRSLTQVSYGRYAGIYPHRFLESGKLEDAPYIWVQSYVSFDHAKKIAVEKRQELIRSGLNMYEWIGQQVETR